MSVWGRSFFGEVNFMFQDFSIFFEMFRSLISSALNIPYFVPMILGLFITAMILCLIEYFFKGSYQK